MIPEKLPICEDETGRRWTLFINVPSSYDKTETKEEIYRRYNAFAEQQSEIEQLRTQLVGRGVAALQNTTETIKQRIRHADYGWSACYQDVCDAIDREMALRTKVAEQQKQIDEKNKLIERQENIINAAELWLLRLSQNPKDFTVAVALKILAAGKGEKDES